MEFVLADVTKPGRLPVAYPFSSAILHRAAPSLYNLTVHFLLALKNICVLSKPVCHICLTTHCVCMYHSSAVVQEMLFRRSREGNNR